MLIETILIGLAGWRLANFLTDEDGPFAVAEKLRQAVGLKPGIVTGFFPLLFSCIFCMSVWTVIGAWIIYQFIPEVVIVMAGMSIALMANSIIKRE